MLREAVQGTITSALPLLSSDSNLVKVDFPIVLKNVPIDLLLEPAEVECTNCSHLDAVNPDLVPRPKPLRERPLPLSSRLKPLPEYSDFLSVH